ncbi:putative membrane protein YkoY [Lentibacillus sp. JNUCC-1]|nr:putative membrane protein YkoY [Lentibacillus sp. JNUCC-1]
MDGIWLEYGWTLLVLIGLEGILSADNALVMAVIAKHLPDDQKRKRSIMALSVPLFLDLVPCLRYRSLPTCGRFRRLVPHT